MRDRKTVTAQQVRVEAISPDANNYAVTVVVTADGELMGRYTGGTWQLWESVDPKLVTEAQVAEWLAGRGYAAILTS